MPYVAVAKLSKPLPSRIVVAVSLVEENTRSAVLHRLLVSHGMSLEVAVSSHRRIVTVAGAAVIHHEAVKGKETLDLLFNLRRKLMALSYDLLLCFDVYC